MFEGPKFEGRPKKKSFGRRESPPVEGLPLELTPDDEKKLEGLKSRRDEIRAYIKEREGASADRPLLKDLDRQIAELELRGLKHRLAKLKTEHPEVDTTPFDERIAELESQVASPEGEGQEDKKGDDAA